MGQNGQQAAAMIDSRLELFSDDRRRRVRLGTLVLLRWVSIAGQTITVAVVSQVFGLKLPMGPIALAIAASVVVNLSYGFIGETSHRLTGEQVAMMLGFDIAQLAVLLFLTGGLENPFALLLLLHATVAASILRRNLMIALLVLAGALTVLLNFAFVPLRDASGAAMHIPELVRGGMLVAHLFGLTFLAFYTNRVTSEMVDLALGLAAAQLALERTQKLTDLGGVVAATAHELGTPLATIKLAASELADELEDAPELQDDARLIVESADRCRDILRSMGRAGKEDMQVKSAPLEAVLREAAEPHMGRGKEVRISLASGEAQSQPAIWRRPEVIHGLRNLIQNAVDFADSLVDVRASWNDSRLVVRISDDGAGFPPLLIGRLGEPMPRRRRPGEEAADRKEYEGMGLGLFIATTLLEHSGARVSFANGGNAGILPGAMAIIDWPRDEIVAPAGANLGENELLRL